MFLAQRLAFSLGSRAYGAAGPSLIMFASTVQSDLLYGHSETIVEDNILRILRNLSPSQPIDLVVPSHQSWPPSRGICLQSLGLDTGGAEHQQSVHCARFCCTLLKRYARRVSRLRRLLANKRHSTVVFDYKATKVAANATVLPNPLSYKTFPLPNRSYLEEPPKPFVVNAGKAEISLKTLSDPISQLDLGDGCEMGEPSSLLIRAAIVAIYHGKRVAIAEAAPMRKTREKAVPLPVNPPQIPLESSADGEVSPDKHEASMFPIPTSNEAFKQRYPIEEHREAQIRYRTRMVDVPDSDDIKAPFIVKTKAPRKTLAKADILNRYIENLETVAYEIQPKEELLYAISETSLRSLEDARHTQHVDTLEQKLIKPDVRDISHEKRSQPLKIIAKRAKQPRPAMSGLRDENGIRQGKVYMKRQLTSRQHSYQELTQAKPIPSLREPPRETMDKEAASITMDRSARADCQEALNDKIKTCPQNGNLVEPGVARLNLQPSKELAYPDLSHLSLNPVPYCYGHPAKAEPIFGIDPEHLKFRSPLGYQIAADRLRRAMNAKPSRALVYWQYSLYRGADGSDVRVHYCKDRERSEVVASQFLEERVIGFDIEWQASAKASDGITKNVALIQIASEQRIALFHLARFPGTKAEDLVPPALKTIMESPHITKVGVAIKGDCTRLRNHLNIASQGLFELSHLHNVLTSRSEGKMTANKRLAGLAHQVKEHLGLPLLKDSVQTSDWTKDLDYAQVRYAASDSYAGLFLYLRMDAKRKALHPLAPRPAHAELGLELLLFEKLVPAAPSEDMADTLEESETDSVSDTDVPIADPKVEEAPSNASGGLSLSKHDFGEGRLTSGVAAVQRLRVQRHAASEIVSARDVEISRALEDAHAWARRYETEEVPLPAGSQPSLSATSNSPSKRKLSATPSQLRAYYLWHDCKYDVSSVAGILRNPPLGLTTIVAYVCGAICEEKLPYNAARIAQFDTHGRMYVKEHQRLITNAQEEMRKQALNG